MVTMTDVAVRAGVSQATVSFVLGGRADSLKISEQTRDRVLTVARELGYQRNQIARAMITGKSRIIGVLTTPESGDNVVRILTGAMEAASQNDYLLKVVHLSWAGVDDATIARCLEWRLAGAVVVGFSEESHQKLNNAFRKSNIPVAVIDNVPPINWGARISSDDSQGIRDVVAHLVGLGHHKIAYIGGRTGPLSTWREDSFRSAIQDHGFPLPEHWVKYSSWGDQNLIETQVRALFSESGDRLPTAIVCSADGIAMVVIRIARSLGMRLPEDLSVTGYSNSSLSDFVDPSLTTVDQSFHEMGHCAAMQVISFADADDADEILAPKKVLLPTKLVVRKSTALPRAEL